MFYFSKLHAGLMFILSYFVTSRLILRLVDMIIATQIKRPLIYFQMSGRK